MLAPLKDASQNQVVEALFIAGGLHSAVDSEWSAGKSDQPKPTAAAPVSQVTPTPKPVTTAAPAPIPQAAPAPPKPAFPRDGWMPEVPKVTDDTEVSPYLKDDVPW